MKRKVLKGNIARIGVARIRCKKRKDFGRIQIKEREPRTQIESVVHESAPGSLVPQKESALPAPQPGQPPIIPPVPNRGLPLEQSHQCAYYPPESYVSRQCVDKYLHWFTTTDCSTYTAFLATGIDQSVPVHILAQEWFRWLNSVPAHTSRHSVSQP